MRIFILLAVLSFFTTDLAAQFACGTSDETYQVVDQKKLELIKKRLAQKSSTKDSVALTFHIVDNAVGIETILNEIQLLNNYFSDRYLFDQNIFSHN